MFILVHLCIINAEGQLNYDLNTLIMNFRFIVATVPTNVHGNYIAWSKEVSKHQTIEEAKKAASNLEMELNQQLQDREDFGNGAVRGEDVIIHDGYNIY